jgi:chromate reductase
VSSPEYNGSVPGQLKNAVDWMSRASVGAPLRGKTVAVMGTSTGQFGGLWGQAELRKVLGIVGARVVPTELAVPKGQHRLAEPDEALRTQVTGLVAELLAAARVAGEAVAA